MRTLQVLGFGLTALLAAFVGLASLRYAMPSPPGVPPDVARNLHLWALAFHAVTAALAMLLGPLQFFPVRSGRRPRWHRATGVAYAMLCLLSAPAGLVLALGTSAGPIAVAGFGLLAVIWFGTTGLGVEAVLQRRYADHRRWMIRSFALTLAAVTLRLYLPIPPLLGIDFTDGYRAISFLCWVPNLLIAEALIALGPRSVDTTRLARNHARP